MEKAKCGASSKIRQKASGELLGNTTRGQTEVERHLRRRGEKGNIKFGRGRRQTVAIEQNVPKLELGRMGRSRGS